MKKSRLTKLIAVVLALTLAFSSFGAVTVGASSAYPFIDSENPIGIIFSDIIDTILRFVLDLFAGLFSDGPGFTDKESAMELAEDNYYEGIGKEFVSEAEEDDEQNFMEGYELNVVNLVNNEILMSWPMKVLCKPQCKGICTVCGKDLNTGECGCDTFVPDPRWAALKDIFNANKEV